MTKCKYCGANNPGNYKFFVCHKCGRTNEGDINKIFVENAKSMTKLLGEKH